MYSCPCVFAEPQATGMGACPWHPSAFSLALRRDPMPQRADRIPPVRARVARFVAEDVVEQHEVAMLERLLDLAELLGEPGEHVVEAQPVDEQGGHVDPHELGGLEDRLLGV